MTGVKPEEPLHSPAFNFNDEVLGTGARFWVKLVESQLPVAPAPRLTTQVTVQP